MQNKNIIITGGLGFLGFSLVQKFYSENNIMIIDNLSSNVHKVNDINYDKSINLFELDINDNKIPNIIENFKPDLVIHTAAQTSVLDSIKNPENNNLTNIDGTENIIKSIQNLRDCFFVLISSGGAVYGTPNYLPVDENHLLNPISPYGISKMEAEKLTIKYLKNEENKFSIIRPSNIYGPNQKNLNVIPKYINLMKRNEDISIYGNGSSTRDYIYIKDIVKIIYEICSRKYEGTYNISSNLETKIIDIFLKLKEILQYKKNPKYLPNIKGEINNIYLDNSKIINLIPNLNFTSIDEGLLKTVNS